MHLEDVPKQARTREPGEPHGAAVGVAWATTLAFTGMLLTIVGSQLLSDAVPVGNRYRGNGALVLLAFGALAALTAAWALLALQLGAARHPARGTLVAGATALLLAFPADLLPAWSLPGNTLFVLALLSTAVGVGLARPFMPPTTPALLAGLATLLLQCTLLIAGGTGPLTLLPLALPPTLVAPLVTAVLGRAHARWRVIGWLAAGGLLAVPCGIIGGYAAGSLILRLIGR